MNRKLNGIGSGRGLLEALTVNFVAETEKDRHGPRSIQSVTLQGIDPSTLGKKANSTATGASV
jgi:hypothetical protein